MLGQLGLYQHPARRIGAAGTAGHLHQFSKQPLRRTEIGAIKAAVGIEHHHQIEPRKIVAFGQHLRAHQNIDFIGADALIQSRPIVFMRGAVAIHALDTRARQHGAQGFFHPLRALAHGG